jgi:hypothetical protein
MDLSPDELRIRRRAMQAMRSGRIRTFFTLSAVGVLTSFLGLFLIALDVFDLDSEFEASSFGWHVAAWGVAGLFLLVGGFLLLKALLSLGGRGQRAHALLFEHPEQIDGAWRQVNTQSGTMISDNEGLAGSHSLVLESRDGQSFSVIMSALQVTLCLRWVAVVAPKARRVPRA